MRNYFNFNNSKLTLVFEPLVQRHLFKHKVHNVDLGSTICANSEKCSIYLQILHTLHGPCPRFFNFSLKFSNFRPKLASGWVKNGFIQLVTADVSVEAIRTIRDHHQPICLTPIQDFNWRPFQDKKDAVYVGNVSSTKISWVQSLTWGVPKAQLQETFRS